MTHLRIRRKLKRLEMSCNLSIHFVGLPARRNRRAHNNNLKASRQPLSKPGRRQRPPNCCLLPSTSFCGRRAGPMAAEAGDVATAPLDEAAILEPPVDQTVIELLAARLAQPSEGNASPTGTGSLAEGATPNVTGDAEAALLAAELALEPQEPLFYARLEQCPFPEDGTGASFLLDRPYCVIGRRTAPEDPVHVSIDSTKVSRRHARIQFNHNIGAYELLVWGRNGAFIEYPEWYEGAPEPDRKIFTEGSEMPQPVPLVHEYVLVPLVGNFYLMGWPVLAR